MKKIIRFLRKLFYVKNAVDFDFVEYDGNNIEELKNLIKKNNGDKYDCKMINEHNRTVEIFYKKAEQYPYKFLSIGDTVLFLKSKKGNCILINSR